MVHARLSLSLSLSLSLTHTHTPAPPTHNSIILTRSGTLRLLGFKPIFHNFTRVQLKSKVKLNTLNYNLQDTCVHAAFSSPLSRLGTERTEILHRPRLKSVAWKHIVTRTMGSRFLRILCPTMKVQLRSNLPINSKCIFFFVFLLLGLSVIPERFIRCQYKYWCTALRRAKYLCIKKGDSEVPFIKGDPKTDPKAHLFYTYCRKNRHTRKTCWKVHGKPPNYGKLHLANAQNEDGVEPMIYGGVSQDGSTSSKPLEIEKLREEIEYVAYIHQSQNGLSKFAPRAVKATFVGYFNTQKGYKFYDPRYQKFIVRINVTFDEKKHDLHIEILKENEAPEMIPINFSAPPPPPN
ncbi:unnamed protein product [Spirodela intermedia]|uniref:Retroviral polymerase SH3-like domain-containing protein n=1 Tax=Spirodela intermedia TaxID=51605 RepID=A0A7I8JN06_SPIIN|nr:unnamed protein product [Spirodela intermedia]CAA6671538.1 unnamed protein product [Spirodela intermedia]